MHQELARALRQGEARCKVSPKDQVLEKAEHGIKQAGVTGEILHKPAARAQRRRGFTNLLGGLTQLAPGARHCLLLHRARVNCDCFLSPLQTQGSWATKKYNFLKKVNYLQRKRKLCLWPECNNVA